MQILQESDPSVIIVLFNVYIYIYIYIYYIQVMPFLSHSRDDVVLCVVRILSRMMCFGNKDAKKDAQNQLGKYFLIHGAPLFSRVYAILEDVSSVLLGEQ